MASLLKNFIPIKWFTIEQAINEIKEITNIELDIDNILHLAKSGELELCLEVREISNRLIDIYDQYFETNCSATLAFDDKNAADTFLALFNKEHQMSISYDYSSLDLHSLEQAEYAPSFLESDQFSYSGLIQIYKSEINDRTKTLEIDDFILKNVSFSEVESYDEYPFELFFTISSPFDISIDKAVIPVKSLSDFIRNINVNEELYILGFEDLKKFTAEYKKSKKTVIKLEQANARIKELEDEIERLKQAQENIAPVQNAEENEQNIEIPENHLQMMAILAVEVAKNRKFLQRGSKINKSALSALLATSEVSALFEVPKGEETFRALLKPLELDIRD